MESKVPNKCDKTWLLRALYEKWLYVVFFICSFVNINSMYFQDVLEAVELSAWLAILPS